MKRFQSKVSVLHDLRKSREEQALRSYAEVVLIRQRSVINLETVTAARSSLYTEIQRAISVGCSATLLSQFLSYRDGLETEWTTASEVLRRASEVVETSLVKVMDARRERELIEKFKSMVRFIYDMEAFLDEQKRLDELALRRMPLGWG